MPYIIKDSKKEYDPAPEGLHQAICIDVVELGLQKRQYQGQIYETRMSEIRWVIDEINPKTKKPYMVTKRYTESLHKKSRLRQELEAWRGRPFTNEELKGFDIEKLVGANCQLQIAHNIGSDGTTYANIQAIVQLHRNAAKMALPTDYVRVQDRPTAANGNGNGHEAGAEEPNDEWVPF